MRRLAWVALVLWMLFVGLFAAISEGFVPQTPGELLIAILLVGPILVLAEPMVEVVLYGIGRLALPLATLGRARSETRDEAHSFPWYGVTRGADRRLVVSVNATSVFGFVCAASLVAGAVFLSQQE